MQHPLVLIHQGQGPHAGAALQRTFHPPGLDGSQQGFGVGMAAPGGSQPGGIELAAQLLMVDNLAVEGNHITARSTGHRLVASSREIENGQALVGKGNAKRLLLPDASRIRPAMGDRCAHACRYWRKAC